MFYHPVQLVDRKQAKRKGNGGSELWILKEEEEEDDEKEEEEAGGEKEEGCAFARRNSKLRQTATREPRSYALAGKPFRLYRYIYEN